MVMYYVYVMQLRNSTLYIGRTNDLKRRAIEHQQGKVRSTRQKSPKLIYYEAYIEKSDANRRELFLKTGDGRSTLHRQLGNYFMRP